MQEATRSSSSKCCIETLAPILAVELSQLDAMVEIMSSVSREFSTEQLLLTTAPITITMRIA